MSDPPPGFLRTPTPLAAVLVALSVLPLPAKFRGRWSEEYRAEIVELRRGRQIVEAGSALAGSFALRSALKARDSQSVSTTVTGWSCRLGRHRYHLVNQDNPENRRYQLYECIRCGKFKEGPTADLDGTGRPFMGGGGIIN